MRPSTKERQEPDRYSLPAGANDCKTLGLWKNRTQSPTPGHIINFLAYFILRPSPVRYSGYSSQKNKLDEGPSKVIRSMVLFENTGLMWEVLLYICCFIG